MEVHGRIHMKILLLSMALFFSFPSLSAFGADENFLKHLGRTEWQAGGFYEGTFEDGTTFQMNLPF